MSYAKRGHQTLSPKRQFRDALSEEMAEDGEAAQSWWGWATEIGTAAVEALKEARPT